MATEGDMMKCHLMRDNHTFRRLPDKWSNDVASILEEEYRAGETALLVGRKSKSVVMRYNEQLGEFLDRVRREVYEEEDNANQDKHEENL